MFMEDSQKRFWVATHDGGLNLFNKETGVCKRYLHNPDDPHSISNNTVFYIIEDRNKTIWIATFGGGLNRYVPEKDNFISYQHSTQDACPISDNYLLGLFEDSSGYIWIGTNGSGLNRYNPKTGKFKQFNNTHGLAGNVVYEIREDKEGCLWISTGSGLSRFNPEMLIFRNYDFHDGLQSNEFNLYSALKSRSGLFYFGGINGITIFNPQEIQDNKKIPPVVLTEFSIFGKPVQLGQILNDRVLLPSPVFNLKQIELKHNENVVSFEFAALHYVAPEKNHYAYKLEGLEKKWNYSKNRRFVTYSSIPPGDYVFRVKASNNNNIWNETGTAINIKIIPPFWRANWFIVLLFSALIGLIFIIYRYRVEKIHLREQELEQLVIERTIQLEQANRELKRLATIDSLTGIANHRWLVQFMNHEWRRSARINKPISLIAIDVDYFKLYNDTYGHQMGDECLKKIANVMKCIANRPGDLAARYGGEEFMVILSETDQKGAAIIAEKIRSGVEQLKIIHEKSITHPFVTISAGVATVIPDESQNYSALINLADRALYISKNNGRNQINHI
jgi:diguanylate cyclase (GGDEF)-like protein